MRLEVSAISHQFSAVSLRAMRKARKETFAPVSRRLIGLGGCQGRRLHLSQGLLNLGAQFLGLEDAGAKVG